MTPSIFTVTRPRLGCAETARKISTQMAFVISTATLAVTTFSQAAFAQAPSLNNETLSSLEEPLATEIGDVTFLLNGLADVPLTLDLDSGDDTFDAGFVGNFQLSAETQLPNRWTLGLAYFGQYDADADDYTDNVAGFVGGAWGTVFGGNVSGLVREETRRIRGTGNAALAFDDTYGRLTEWSAGYRGRFGPFIASAILDEDENFDLGLTFQRPIGNKDYRLTARYTDSTFTAADGITTFDSQALSGVGEFIYGSTLFDLGIGYEDLSASVSSADRWYSSAGVTTKFGIWTLSAEGHYGEVDGQSETSAALGIRYDIARGLSANFGLNYQDAQINIDGINYVNTEDTRAIVSLRYSF